MSKQCNCSSSRLFPHRADKCALSTKKARKKAHTDSHEASPIPTPAENATEHDVLDNETIDIGSVASAVEQLDPPLETSTGNELSAAQEVAASNLLLANGNEQCDCIAYRFKKHRKKKCSWKKHVAVGLATASVIAGTIVLATVLADGDGSEKNDDCASNSDTLYKKKSSRSKNAAVGLATATIVTGTAVLATVVVCEVQKSNVDPKQSSNYIDTLPAGVNTMHLHATEPEAPSTETETAGSDDVAPATTEEEQEEPLEEEEPESEVEEEEEEESEEDLEARIKASIVAERWEEMRREREAAAAILRAQRAEAQRVEKERLQQQQQQPEEALC